MAAALAIPRDRFFFIRNNDVCESHSVGERSLCDLDLMDWESCVEIYKRSWVSVDWSLAGVFGEIVCVIERIVRLVVGS